MRSCKCGQPAMLRSDGTSRYRCRDCERASAKAWRAKNPNWIRQWEDRNRKRRREAIRIKNGRQPVYPCPGHCEACGKTIVDGGRPRAESDHQHSTGKWRGWLCTKCNHDAGAIEGPNFNAVSHYLRRTAEVVSERFLGGLY